MEENKLYASHALFLGSSILVVRSLGRKLDNLLTIYSDAKFSQELSKYAVVLIFERSGNIVNEQIDSGWNVLGVIAKC